MKAVTEFDKAEGAYVLPLPEELDSSGTSLRTLNATRGESIVGVDGTEGMLSVGCTPVAAVRMELQSRSALCNGCRLTPAKKVLR